MQAKLLLANDSLEDTQGRLAKLLEEEKAAHQKDIEESKKREMELEKKKSEYAYHEQAETKLSEKDKSLKNMEKERDQFLNELEDERKKRHGLQAELLMAREAVKTEFKRSCKKCSRRKRERIASCHCRFKQATKRITNTFEIGD